MMLIMLILREINNLDSEFLELKEKFVGEDGGKRAGIVSLSE